MCSGYIHIWYIYIYMLYMPMLNCKRTSNNSNTTATTSTSTSTVFNKPEIEHTHQHNWLSFTISHSFLHDDSISIWVRIIHKIRSHLNWCCCCCCHRYRRCHCRRHRRHHLWCFVVSFSCIVRLLSHFSSANSEWLSEWVYVLCISEVCVCMFMSIQKIYTHIHTHTLGADSP